MSTWAGFTDRLRRHGRCVADRTTRAYLDVAADRIEELEEKLRHAIYEADEAERRLRERAK